MRKKGASEVVSIILLILIAVMIIAILIYFVFDYLNNKDEEIDLVDDLNKEDLGINDVTFESSGGKDYIVLSLKKGSGQQLEIDRTGGVGAAVSQGVVLVSDVSGSMEWVDNIAETTNRLALWKDDSGDNYCGLRRYYLGNNPNDKKVEHLKDASKYFVELLEKEDETYVGMVEYTSRNQTKKVEKPDLSVSVYLNSSTSRILNNDPNCGQLASLCSPEAWQAIDYDDGASAGWSNFGTSFSTIFTDSRHMKFFRKSFYINSEEDLNKIKDLTLKLAYATGIVCFINDKEVAYYTNYASMSSFSKKIQVPIKVLQVGKNILACQISVHHDSGGNNPWGFNSELTAKNITNDNVHLIPSNIQGWKIISKGDCNSGMFGDYLVTDPKWIKQIKKSSPTDITLHATVKNTGLPINTPFDVSFYRVISNIKTYLGKVTIPRIGSRELISVKFPITETINSEIVNYSAVVDDDGTGSGVILESSETNNQDSRFILTYTVKPDLIGKVDPSTVNTCTSGLQTFNVIVAVQNMASEDPVLASQKFNVSLHYKSNHHTINSVEVSRLICPGHRGIAHVSIPATVNIPAGPPGTKVLFYASVDTNNNIDESNENNNNYSHWPILAGAGDSAFNLRYPNPYISKFDVVNRICSLTPSVGVNIRVDNQFCPMPTGTNLVLSSQKDSWTSPNGHTVALPALPAGGSYSGTFSLSLNLTQLANNSEPFVYYGDIDTLKLIVEDNENNFMKMINYTGTNLKLEYFELSPQSVDSGVSRKYTIKANIRNERNCASGNFIVRFNKTDLDFSNPELLCEVTLNLAGGDNRDITCEFTKTLTKSANISILVDATNTVIESNPASDNIHSEIITVIGGLGTLSPFVSTPLSSVIGLKNIFLAIYDWRIDECTGTDTILFPGSGTDTSVARTFSLLEPSLSNNINTINSFIDDTQTYWETCICCGIYKAKELLDAGNTDKKIIVLLSDGIPNIPCTTVLADSATESDRVTASKADAITAAEAAAAAPNNVIIYTIGFGKNADIDSDTLEEIASRSGGEYYHAENKEELKNSFKSIADSIKVTYKSVVSYDHLKVVIYARGTSFTTTLKSNKVPAPLETKDDIKVPFNPPGGITTNDITRIELYSVAILQSGKNITSSQPISIWNKPSEY